MDPTFASAFSMWLGLMSLVPMPTYEIEHFYTYDKDRKQQGLLLQKKVFIPEYAHGAEDYLERTKRKTTRLEFPHTAGWVVTVANNREAIELMDDLVKNRIMYFPVVRWDGMDCLPGNVLIIKTKPFVTEKMLHERLSKASKITLIPHGKIGDYGGKLTSIVRDGDVWLVTLEVPYAFPNILVLANMISEDATWVEWARVQFLPIFSPMSGDMFVTTPAVLNLGYDKQLEIVITVYKPSVKIRKDLLPQLGQRFLPLPQKDAVWYDIGPTEITEERTPEKTVVRMVTKFRFLNHGVIAIPNIEVAYDDGKEEGTFLVKGMTYTVQSVIKGTPIDDIQARPAFTPVVRAADPPAFTRIVLPWSKIGLIGAGVGVGLLLLLGFVVTVKSFGGFLEGRRLVSANRRLWYDLQAAVSTLDKADWRDVYKDVSAKLAKVLAVYYGIKEPISSDNMPTVRFSLNLKNILVELEKLYSKNPEPNFKRLISSIDAFVTQDGKAHV